MTIAHRGTNLRPGRMPFPLPESAMLFPLSGDLSNDRGDRMVGNYVVRGESPFGDGAVAFDKASTNLLTNGDFSNGLAGWTTQQAGAGESVVAVKDDYTPVGDTYARMTAVDAANDALFLVSDLFTLAPSTDYTLSGYFRNSLKNVFGGNAQFYVLSNTGTQIQALATYGGNTTLTYKYDTPGWSRFSLPFTTAANITGKNQYLRVDADAPGIVDVTGLKIETGTYATSFANGSLPAGSMTIPLKHLNYYNGTMAFWVKTNYSLPSTSVGSVNFLSTGLNSLRMWKWNGSATHMFVLDWNQADNTRLNIDVSNNDTGMDVWTHVAFTWVDAKTFVLYINGQVVGSRTCAAGQSFYPFQGDLVVSGDCMMTDLVIDSKPWTPDAVMGLFLSGCRAFSGRDRATVVPSR